MAESPGRHDVLHVGPGRVPLRLRPARSRHHAQSPHRRRGNPVHRGLHRRRLAGLPAGTPATIPDQRSARPLRACRMRLHTHHRVSLHMNYLAFCLGSLSLSLPSGFLLTPPRHRTIHLVLFVRACVERSREIRRRRPRVMYIPETGQTIYVVAKPFPKLPTWKSQQQRQPSARAGSFPRSPQSPIGSISNNRNINNNNNNSSPLHRHSPQLQLEVPPPPPLPKRWPSELSPSMSSIKRKPVRGVPRNIAAGDRERLLRPNMRPPPEGYEPSAEELERRRRGDAQPQLIMPGDVDIKFATSATGLTPADASAREGKYRVDASQMSGMAPAGEASATGNGRGRRQSA
ncbi:hypothetical protein CTA1_9462 [Colletotrichum tanaceti]|uniref:Uncharacterized protein n=1 Tax=Colletotrichum tanaceti TaxID=1306861 RepID=A0A4U6X6H7_9PEZI|nr:hypothetical protein CTA1_9462 [Colletotrichum tanaceti]